MQLARREAGGRWAGVPPGHVAGMALCSARRQASCLPGPLPGDCLTSQPHEPLATWAGRALSVLPPLLR